MLVAVIDLGKSNSKVALVNTAIAREINVVTQRSVVNTQTLYPSLDHRAIESFVVDALQNLSAQHSIDAVTVTTHGATVALLDNTGSLAMPVLDYEFRGVDSARDDYQHHRPPFSETGSPALPGGLNIGAQLYWLQQNFPVLFSTVDTILTWPQYWVHWLTGHKHNDVTSLGCHSDLYRPDQKTYSSLIDAMQWRHLMPPTRQPGQLSGPLQPAIAQQTGLPENTPVYTGIHDSNASLVPHLLAQCGTFTVVSTGTWFIAMAMGGTPVVLDEAKDTLLNVNAHGQSVPSSRFMGGRERELLGITEPACSKAMDTLLRDPSTAPYLMPSLVPDTGPFPDASTHWVNRANDTHSTHRDCAVTLYLALMTNECMVQIGSDGPTFIEGPLAHDSCYAKMLAAASGRPVMISQSQTGTSVGAAMLIKAPDAPPACTAVTLSPDDQQQLQRYATQWQRYLSEHLTNPPHN